MKLKTIVGMMLASLVLAGCASNAPAPDDTVQFQASDRALQLLDQQGKATATMLGYADDTDLVCERFYKTGSHITTSFCYTRAEMERRLLNHQEEWRNLIKGGPCLPQLPQNEFRNVGIPTAAGCGGGGS